MVLVKLLFYWGFNKMNKLSWVALDGLRKATSKTKEMNLEYLCSQNFKQKAIAAYESEQERKSDYPSNILADFHGEDEEGKRIVYVLENAYRLIDEIDRLKEGLKELDEITFEYMKKSGTDEELEFNNKEMVNVSNKISDILYPRK